MKCCMECGARLEMRPLEHEGMVPFCPQCGEFRFPMYNVAVSMIVVHEPSGKMLLVKQYGKDFYRLVAGYVNRGEMLEHAVSRELKEEMGLTAVRIYFNRTEFFEPSNTLMCNFTAFVENLSELETNDEIDSYAWFTPEEAQKAVRPEILAGRFLNSYLAESGDNAGNIAPRSGEMEATS